MQIKSATFVRGITTERDKIHDGLPQILFIGRSNVGKSSVINTLTKTKGLAISSSTPGRTQQVNAFLINKQFYVIDLPGYGYARGSDSDRLRIRDLISWYVFMEHQEDRRVILIIDLEVGLTESDIHMVRLLREDKAEFLLVANKADKLKNQKLKVALQKVQNEVGSHKVIPFSAKKHTGVDVLMAEALKNLKAIKKEDLFETLEENRYPDKMEEEI